MTNKAASNTKLSFEEAYQRLEQVIATLEDGELNLDRSIALFEEGMQLAEICEHKLDAAQLKVTNLLERDQNDPSDEAEGSSPALDTAPPAEGGAGRQASYLTFTS